MKKFAITEDQLNKILAALGEVPAKHSFNAIVLLKNLEEIKEEPKKD